MILSEAMLKSCHDVDAPTGVGAKPDGACCEQLELLEMIRPEAREAFLAWYCEQTENHARHCTQLKQLEAARQQTEAAYAALLRKYQHENTLRTGRVLKTLSGHEASIYALAYSPCGQWRIHHAGSISYQGVMIKL